MPGVGGRSRRPRVVADDIVVRDVLDLTVTIDRDVVDGAPAARFEAGLRHPHGAASRRPGHALVVPSRLPALPSDGCRRDDRRVKRLVIALVLLATGCGSSQACGLVGCASVAWVRLDHLAPTLRYPL